MKDSNTVLFISFFCAIPTNSYPSMVLSSLRIELGCKKSRGTKGLLWDLVDISF